MVDDPLKADEVLSVHYRRLRCTPHSHFSRGSQMEWGSGRARSPRVQATCTWWLTQRAGVSEVVTCNTITHPTNRIDVSHLLAGHLRERVEVATEKAVRPTGLAPDGGLYPDGRRHRGARCSL